MNREIKFRAWSKSEEIMIKWESLIKTIRRTVDYDIFHDEELELLQYTGLKDKNWKGIYEGDIGNQTRGKWKGIGKIIFSEGCFWFQRKIGSNEELYIAITNDEIEIIGNIYENPELLK